MRKTILLIFVAMLAFTWSCQKEEAADKLTNQIENILKTEATEAGVEPVLFDTGAGGNVECNELGIEVEFSSGRINFEDGAFQFPEGESWPDGLEVTVTDGKFVSWSYEPVPFFYTDEDGTWINLVGAVIVKGGNAANVYFYNEEDDYDYYIGGWIDSDSGLRSPDNQGGNIADLSNLTFCFVRKPFFPPNNQPPNCFEWQTETAWAANGEEPGTLRYTPRGNWATYLEFDGAEKTVSLFAGQTTFVGTVTLTPVGDDVEISITLDGGWELAIEDYDEFGEPVEGVYREETVKIQGYNVRPSGNPAPGQFTYKGNDLTWTVPAYDFYGIHLDVGILTLIECPEED